MSLASLQHQSWKAALELGFALRGSRTALVHRYHHGPLRVQSPFYPEGDVSHVYLLHPPGGVVGGDELAINVAVETGAHALVTTPASGKFYRSNGVTAIQKQQLKIADDAVLEWLPQDTIFFSKSFVQMHTRVELAQRAKFIGWEMLCFGRPACGEAYDEGFCRQSLEVWREGKPLFIERALYESNSELLNSHWGLQGKPVTATLVAVGANEETLLAARTVQSEIDSLLSCTLMDDVLVCRLLTTQGAHARELFCRIWQAIRPQLLGRSASPPRIWNT